MVNEMSEEKIDKTVNRAYMAIICFDLAWYLLMLTSYLCQYL